MTILPDFSPLGYRVQLRSGGPLMRVLRVTLAYRHEWGRWTGEGRATFECGWYDKTGNYNRHEFPRESLVLVAAY